MMILIPLNPYDWQTAANVQKGDTKALPEDAYLVYQYLEGMGQYILSAALVAAYRDHERAWLDAFQKQFCDSFIDPDTPKAKESFDPDLLSEVRHYRNAVKALDLPVKIKQLSLLEVEPCQ
jgi:hypothetical protein